MVGNHQCSPMRRKWRTSTLIQKKVLVPAVLGSMVLLYLWMTQVTFRYRPLAYPRDKIESSMDHCKMGQELPSWQQFFSLVGDTRACTKMEKFGGEGEDPARDGAKAVCMDTIFAPKAGNCNVLSFGINNEWSFDDALANRSCKVFSFDPTMGAADHRRGKNIIFYSLGLSGSEGTIETGEGGPMGVMAHLGLVHASAPGFPVDSYRGILKHIGLLNTTIDYLKIDIEGSEYEFFEDVLYKDTELLSQVKQMGVEIHAGKGNTFRRNRMWRILHRLRCLKFRTVFSEPNLEGSNPYLLDDTIRVSDCYEVVWINERFL